MSSVPQSKRALSNMEFYANAKYIRKKITFYILRDFGIKDKIRSLELFPKAKKISEEDKALIQELSRKTVTIERRRLKKYRAMLNNNILTLNTIIQAYQSWRGTYKKFNSHKTIREMDKLFNSLFGGIYDERQTRRTYGRDRRVERCSW